MLPRGELRREALALFRAAFRMSRRLPYVQVASKTRYNVRHLFDVYRDISDPDHIRQLINDGLHYVETMSVLLEDRGIAERLFKPFAPLPTDGRRGYAEVDEHGQPVKVEMPENAMSIHHDDAAVVEQDPGTAQHRQ